MVASLLDEGAGDLDAKAFHERLERKAIELSFRAGRDHFRGTLRTLKENRDEAFDCLRLALTEPRFDAEAVERIRAQIISRLRRETTSPNDIASRNWWATAFPGPSLRPAGRRHARNRCRASPPTICGLRPARARARHPQDRDGRRHRCRKPPAS